MNVYFQNQTRGLFGNWSLDVNDDFTRPDGTRATVDLNNFQSAHRDFAQYCKLLGVVYVPVEVTEQVELGIEPVLSPGLHTDPWLQITGIQL